VLVGVDQAGSDEAAGVAAVVVRPGLADLGDRAVIHDDGAPRSSVDDHVTQPARG
jgi:hypothetical protein